jgi:hypothetical protein
MAAAVTEVTVPAIKALRPHGPTWLFAGCAALERILHTSKGSHAFESSLFGWLRRHFVVGWASDENESEASLVRT